jgi:hypothetical protein
MPRQHRPQGLERPGLRRQVEGPASAVRVWLTLQGARPLDWNPAKGAFVYAPLAQAKRIGQSPA